MADEDLSGDDVVLVGGRLTPWDPQRVLDGLHADVHFENAMAGLTVDPN